MVETRRRTLAIVAIAAATVLMLGCRSDTRTDDIFAEPTPTEGQPSDGAADGPTDDAEPSAQREVTRPSGSVGTVEPIDIATVNLDEWTLSPTEAEDALAFYADYLALSDAARLGDEAAAAELDIVTDPLVRYLTEDWQSRNEQLAQENLSIIGLSSTPNVVAVTGSAEGAVVHDCVVQEVTDEFTQATRTEYVEQITVLRQTSGLWLASLVEVLHDGTLGSGPVRCVSNAEQAETEAVVLDALDGLTRAWADPASGAEHLGDLLGQDFLSGVEDEVQRMTDEGFYAEGEQVHSVDVVGAFLTGQAPSYLVATCTTFPDGLTRRSIDTDEPISDGVATAPVSGTLYREWTVSTDSTGASDRLVLATLDAQRVDNPCNQERDA